MDIASLQIQRPPNLLDYASLGDVEGVQEEALRGVDPNIQDSEGNTPLILAAEAGYSIIVEMLLEQFPTLNVDQTNNLGQTALMKSAIQGRIHCARSLLRAGADASKRDFSRGFCALDWSEYVGRTEVKHMIKHYTNLQDNQTKPRKKSSVVQMDDLKKLTAVAAVPLLGDSAETVLPRPRLHSAPIPRLEVTRPSDGVPVTRTQSQGYRPRSSMA